MWPGVGPWRRHLARGGSLVAVPIPTTPLPPAADEAWDLRQWLAAGGARGEARRVAAAVAPDQEMTTITSLVGQRVGAPALLFEQIAGHPGQRALWNLLGSSRERYALAMGLPAGQTDA